MPEIIIIGIILKGRFGRKSHSLEENVESQNTGSQKGKYFVHLCKKEHRKTQGPSPLLNTYSEAANPPPPPTRTPPPPPPHQGPHLLHRIILIIKTEQECCMLQT